MSLCHPIGNKISFSHDCRNVIDRKVYFPAALGEPKWAEVMNRRTLSGDVAAGNFRDLGRLNDPRALAPIGRILENNPNNEIRKRAEEDLIGFTDPNALPILKKALSDESNLVQKNAEIALSYFEG